LTTRTTTAHRISAMASPDPCALIPAIPAQPPPTGCVPVRPPVGKRSLRLRGRSPSSSESPTTSEVTRTSKVDQDICQKEGYAARIRSRVTWSGARSHRT
jgi:hypothetical protein